MDDVIWLYYSDMYAYRIEDFDCAMAELKETYRKVYDELLGAGKDVFFMTTSIAESMNFCLLTVRKLPITTMVEFIRDFLQKWFYNHQTNACEMSTYLTTFADEHIKDRTKIAHQCEIYPIHFNTFKLDGKRKETTVDLDERSCSCHQWDLDELSCSHAMTVASTCKPDKKARTCSICKKEGHNRLKCPDKPLEPTLIDTDEENSAGKPLLNSSE
ncbi:hypothetical protein Dsin_016033 [Dipteronia sinensis]|uniref:SWIM-type domain-containing protein n=1 Tax=Dipteronia sinensis TaxID=43782 RepID=A0AAE0E5C4_9ROSI|nr:hypothetical protein Dsin_016033 [Dipteronia sinensis]